MEMIFEQKQALVQSMLVAHAASVTGMADWRQPPPPANQHIRIDSKGRQIQ